MNAQLIAACTGSTMALAEVFAPHLTFAMDAFAINTPLRQAMFLSNVGHESSRMAVLKENLNYRVDALLKFNAYSQRISPEDAAKYGRTATQPANQRAIANCIYGGPWGAKWLGNTQPGDGAKYIGHGLIQCTGRANVQKVRDALRAKFPALNVPDFLELPEALIQPQWAALSAAEFVSRNKLNAVADSGDFDGYCDGVNIGKKTDKYGDASGFSDRLDLFRAAKVALRIT